MSVVINVITGGIKRMMLQKNLTVPKDMNVTFPLALANHPDTLTNYTTLLPCRCPLAITDIQKRIKTTDTYIQQAHIFLSQTTLVYLLAYLLEVLPHWVKQFLLYDIVACVSISCIPLPSGEGKWFGLTKLSSFYDVTVTRTNAGVLVAMMGDGDYFNMSFQIDGRLLSNPVEIRDLEKHILEELEFLGKNCLA